MRAKIQFVMPLSYASSAVENVNHITFPCDAAPEWVKSRAHGRLVPSPQKTNRLKTKYFLALFGNLRLPLQHQLYGWRYELALSQSLPTLELIHGSVQLTVDSSLVAHEVSHFLWTRNLETVQLGRGLVILHLPFAPLADLKPNNLRKCVLGSFLTLQL